MIQNFCFHCLIFFLLFKLKLSLSVVGCCYSVEIRCKSQLIICNLNNAILWSLRDDLIVVSFVPDHLSAKKEENIWIWQQLATKLPYEMHSGSAKRQATRKWTNKKEKKPHDTNERMRKKWRAANIAFVVHSLVAFCSGQMGRSLIVISGINSTMIYVILFTNILSRRHSP